MQNMALEGGERLHYAIVLYFFALVIFLVILVQVSGGEGVEGGG